MHCHTNIKKRKKEKKKERNQVDYNAWSKQCKNDYM